MRKQVFIAFLAALALPLCAAMAQTAPKTGENPFKAWEKGDVPIVVELFTPTDCAGCSLAHSYLYELSKQKNIIALGCPVGRAEVNDPNQTKSESECTDRQIFYKLHVWQGRTEVAIPEFVINGNYNFQVVGSLQLESQMRTGAKASSRVLRADITLPGDEKLLVKLPSSPAAQNEKESSYGVWLIRYQDSSVAKVTDEKGVERIARYTNPVGMIRHIGRWYGEERTIEYDLSKVDPELKRQPGGWVVTVHKINGEEIVVAGHLKDEKRDPRTGLPAERKNP